MLLLPTVERHGFRVGGTVKVQQRPYLFLREGIALENGQHNIVVDQLQGDELPIGAVHERIHALSDLFVEASGNMVLAMVRKGVKTRFIDRHEALLAPPGPERPELLERLARAIADGDGPAAANAIFDITQVVRQGAVESLRAEREQLAEPSKAGAATR